MAEPNSADRRRLSQGSSVKEDLGVVFALGDDTFAQVSKMSRDVRLAIEHLTKLIAEARGLKANDANVLSELTLLRDQADSFSTDLSSLQSAVENHDGIIQEVSAQEMNILASVVETLLDVNDSLESLKASVVGLNTFVKDHPCPWAADSEQMSAQDRIKAITEIVKLLPTLQVVLTKAADREGFITKKDGTDLTEKYWLRKYADKFRDAIVATIFSTLAAGATSFGAWTYFFGAKSNVAKIQAEAKREIHNQLIQAEEAKTKLEVRLKELEDENQHLRSGKKRPAAPTK